MTIDLISMLVDGIGWNRRVNYQTTSVMIFDDFTDFEVRNGIGFLESIYTAGDLVLL